MLHWYALRIFNNRRYQDIVADIRPDEYYVPLDLYARRRPGRRAIHLTERPIESLLFIRVTPRRADELRRQRPRPYMLYESPDPDGHLRPHPIPEHEMTIFRIVTSAGDPDLQLIDTFGLPPTALSDRNIAEPVSSDRSTGEPVSSDRSKEEQASSDRSTVEQASSDRRTGGTGATTNPSRSGAQLRAASTPNPLRPGTRVRVIAGPLAGAEGIIRRVAHQRRLQITVTGVCTLLTGYIPAPLLQPLP